jgi:TetR/AcrR family transcriptional regulator, transcriptional repressor for nem operon
MPYPAGHRERVRNKIVESARRLFNRNGFDNVSVDAIMAHAGLTRGGFYSYFESKSDLYAEVLGCFFIDPNWKSRWDGVNVDMASPEAGPQIVRAYLSRQHFDDVENSCPMVALPSDVARSDTRVKTAFETVFKAMVKLLGRDVKTSLQARENTAMAIAALCIGGMVVARSMNDHGLGDRLREAATGVALDLGGWAPTKVPLLRAEGARGLTAADRQRRKKAGRASAKGRG